VMKNLNRFGRKLSWFNRGTIPGITVDGDKIMAYRRHTRKTSDDRKQMTLT
jgi:hypothetical protein